MSIFEKLSELAKKKLTGTPLVHAFNDGDYMQAFISTANVGQKAVHAATGVAENADILAEKLAEKSHRLLEPALEKLENIKITPEVAENARSVLGKLGVGLVALQGAYSVYKENGVLHKAQRTVATALTAGTGWVTSAAGGVVAKGALTVGERASLWIAPVVLAGEVAYGGNTIIKTERTYESGDSAFKPDMEHHSNVISAEAMVADRLKALGVTRDAAGHWDMTRADNVTKFRQAVAEKQTETRQAMDENTTIMPRWIQFTNKQGDMRAALESAQSNRKILDSALRELPDYQQKQAQHHQQLSDRAQQKATVLRKNPDHTSTTPITAAVPAPDITAPLTPDVRPDKQARDQTITG